MVNIVSVPAEIRDQARAQGVDPVEYYRGILNANRTAEVKAQEFLMTKGYAINKSEAQDIINFSERPQQTIVDISSKPQEIGSIQRQNAFIQAEATQRDQNYALKSSSNVGWAKAFDMGASGTSQPQQTSQVGTSFMEKAKDMFYAGTSIFGFNPAATFGATDILVQSGTGDAYKQFQPNTLLSPLSTIQNYNFFESMRIAGKNQQINAQLATINFEQNKIILEQQKGSLSQEDYNTKLSSNINFLGNSGFKVTQTTTKQGDNEMTSFDIQAPQFFSPYTALKQSVANNPAKSAVLTAGYIGTNVLQGVEEYAIYAAGGEIVAPFVAGIGIGGGGASLLTSNIIKGGKIALDISIIAGSGYSIFSSARKGFQEFAMAGLNPVAGAFEFGTAQAGKTAPFIYGSAKGLVTTFGEIKSPSIIKTELSPKQQMRVDVIERAKNELSINPAAGKDLNIIGNGKINEKMITSLPETPMVRINQDFIVAKNTDVFGTTRDFGIIRSTNLINKEGKTFDYIFKLDKSGGIDTRFTPRVALTLSKNDKFLSQIYKPYTKGELEAASFNIPVKNSLYPVEFKRNDLFKGGDIYGGKVKLSINGFELPNGIGRRTKVDTFSMPVGKGFGKDLSILDIKGQKAFGLDMKMPKYTLKGQFDVKEILSKEKPFAITKGFENSGFEISKTFQGTERIGISKTIGSIKAEKFNPILNFEYKKGGSVSDIFNTKPMKSFNFNYQKPSSVSSSGNGFISSRNALEYYQTKMQLENMPLTYGIDSFATAPRAPKGKYVINVGDFRGSSFGLGSIQINKQLISTKNMFASSVSKNLGNSNALISKTFQATKQVTNQGSQTYNPFVPVVPSTTFSSFSEGFKSTKGGYFPKPELSLGGYLIPNKRRRGKKNMYENILPSFSADVLGLTTKSTLKVSKTFGVNPFQQRRLLVGKGSKSKAYFKFTDI